jgi:hypothetical protein
MQREAGGGTLVGGRGSTLKKYQGKSRDVSTTVLGVFFGVPPPPPLRHVGYTVMVLLTDLKETRCEDVEWDYVAVSRDKWSALVLGSGGRKMTFLFQQYVGKFLTS